jgi:hypothetical protein
MRSCAGATGQPARYVNGMSAAVIVATTPVYAGGPVAGVVVPEVVVVVDPVVDVDALVDELLRARGEPEDPHAPTVTSNIVTTAPAHRCPRTGS